MYSSYMEFPQREFPRSGITGIPIGIPASKTALSWEFPGIPIQRGFCAYRGESFAYRGGVVVAPHTKISPSFLFLVAHLQ